MTQLAVLDFETTGLTAGQDEILQVSIVDETGAVLLNEYCCPQRHTSWVTAQKINGISPEQVADCPPFEALCDTVREILSNAQHVVAYNVSFEQGFLQAYGIAPSSLRWGKDPMLSFAACFDGQKRTLTAVAAFFGYEFGAHNALEDVKATLYAYQALESGSLLSFVTKNAAQTQEQGICYDAVDGEARLRVLKILGLCPFTFTKAKPLVYQGVFTARPEPCEMVGFRNQSRDNDWFILVLRVGERLLCVGDDYLREMQSPAFRREADAAPAPRPVRAGSSAKSMSPPPPQQAEPQKSGRFAAFAKKSSAIKNLEANLAANPENPFYQKNIVFTGDMKMPREEAAQAVSTLGASVKSGVSAKTDFLVIGAQDKALVGEDGVSGKEEKALALNASGKANIGLLREADFLSLLENARK